MKKKLLSLLILTMFSCVSLHAESYVDRHGSLQAKNTRLYDANGNEIQLRGMSLFWSQWQGQYFNHDAIKTLRDDWDCTVVRAAMGVEMGGYIENPIEEKAKLEAVVQAAIDLGIYVIIDWHSHKAQDYMGEAKAFFSEMALKYGEYPNVIYEIYNEPVGVEWSETIKPYSELVIAEIRKYDPDNLIILGTPNYSQKIDVASADPIEDVNVAYAAHYYSDTHKQWLRDMILTAIDNGVTVFVSEFGTCDASGDKGFNVEESNVWWDFMKEHGISWCNWSIADKDETASALKPGADAHGNWSDSMITESGHLVKNRLHSEKTE